jgi:Xaa-Pro aminopeptidase
MDMVLTGENGAAGPEFKHPSHTRRIGQDDLVLYGLEIAAFGGHWVEFSRPFCAGTPSKVTLDAMDAYVEYAAAARATMKAGNTAHDVHMAVSKGFLERGFKLGHVTGHSIGMTMIEFPRVGEGLDVELKENMVISMHPHAITEDERTCLYMQDTWRVTKDGGVPFSDVPIRIFKPGESM